jgi:hypothetical protein
VHKIRNFYGGHSTVGEWQGSSRVVVGSWQGNGMVCVNRPLAVQELTSMHSEQDFLAVSLL